MMFTIRNLTELASLVVVLGMASAANAADTKYVARLDGTRNEPRATGRALWTNSSQEIHFSLGIENLAFNEVALVVIGGEVIDRMDIVDGIGVMHVNIDKNLEDSAAFPRVTAGTKVEVYSMDGDLLLTGKFRQIHR